MIIPLDKQQAEKIKEQHKVRIVAILLNNCTSEEIIKVILEEIHEYNKELGI